MGEFVRLEVADGVGTIRLDRPKMNAISIAVQEELRAAAAEATERDDVRAVVLYGGERVFAAGNDVKEMADMSYQDMVARSGPLQSAVTAIARIPKPVVAAVNGYALGGGCELALAADLRIAAETRRALRKLADDIGQGDLFDVQESYVMLFDRSRTLSLNLFEHVHGESRERGGAMVSLIETYREGGFEPATTELPDHLPVLLEFLASRPFVEAQETLADAAHIFDALAARLMRRESGYDIVFAALSQLAGAQSDADAVAGLLAQPDDDPTDLEALDAVWEETEVTFGPDPNAGCPQIRDMLALMDKPALKATVTNLNRSA